MDSTNFTPGAAADRLRSLILFTGLKDETLAEARALGPAQAGEVVADLIEGELSRPMLERTAVRAAHLAGELGLLRAVPSLVQCVESLRAGEALRRAAITALGRLGAPGLDALLAAFDATGDSAVRCRLAIALARCPGQDDRVRAAFVRLLREAPEHAAWGLAERGEWRAVPDLLRAFDRLADHPIADCEGCAVEHLSTIVCAVRQLGGTVSPLRRAQLEALAERADVVWLPFSDPQRLDATLRTPAVREGRPGRNEPCPCGSGKKYKRCCAGADPGGERH
jgi:hypothetical protein